ncbi:putative allantoin permease [Lentilactobacillus parabuchneri]|jgi:NCS1 family nucleobase:cation symporter-1|uniref:Cytosine purines uracil thiamine allantoin permease n=4 Tax=Lentilactobacillus parabuchneri TaxID=152331 RepID=A0A0R1YWJ0_9LACO|nr:cytosine permease [Lentilactobacillus parabuchneri]APR06843.1 putative allantoin permease [Lentilactobacillus parabuchneri]KRM46928.1 cytosine purines uracil thiamine allantoin permease [Lentilactobacillus parabuchneri DSM 5707 = NBRC 107865]KRN78160.1 cytosine purines uracil thiamine allantoin permease [Lentilactobacillus parabuchneri]MBW0222543.1 cytosine permease [Lentilactobacillus parabuchneri]MBW0245869.1 cytosine permease [Lentilactobacillus parabuchneri]
MEDKSFGRVESIPKEHRHQSYWDMFATWVGANANNGTWYVGGVIAACGFVTASTTLIIVGVITYFLLALSGYMGYKTGLPAMALTRASFGLKGSFLPSVINIVQFIGWAAVNTFIAATSISYILHDVLGWPVYGKPGGLKGLVSGIIVMSILHLLSISMGEKSVRIIERIGIILVFILVIWESIVVFQNVSLSEIVSWHAPAALKMTPGQAVDVLAAFNLAWVTAASDFTRFSKKRASSTWAPFFGANLGLIWFAMIGIISTIATAITLNHFDANNSDPSTIASKLGLGVLAMLVIIITSTTANAVNLMSAGSALTNMTKRLSLTVSIVSVTIVAVFVTFIPIFYSTFLNVFTAFLDGIGMFLGPEIAIFLTDFYVVAKRKYRVEHFASRTGKYWYTGGINWIAIGSWLIAVIAYGYVKQVPVLANSVGATFISMMIAAVIYYVVSRLVYRNQLQED